MNKRKGFLLIIVFFLLLFSYYEIKSDLRIGGVLRDIIYTPLRKDNYKELLTFIDSELKKENDELKELLNINYGISNYLSINASVIERNSTYWLDELTIDKGENDGIEGNQIVITRNGMVGIVISTSRKTSKIKLITGLTSPILVETNGIYKLMYSDNYELYIKGINEEDDIKIGDKVVTGGYSINYPKSILIGEIEEIFTNNDEIEKIAKIKLSENIDDLRYVSILKRVNK